MAHPYSVEVRSQLLAYQNEADGFHMKKYMRNMFDFFGIKADPRRKIVHEFLKKHDLPAEKEMNAVIKDLWEFPERECQYAALDILDRRKVFGEKDIELLEFLVVQKSWWDTVDWLATKLVGAYFQQYPQHIPEITGKWILSDHMWLKRVAILFQLKYKAETDEELLYRYITQCLGSDEFFINKAIGWALREYSKTNAESVVQFVENHELSKLSHTEALKWLKGKGLLG